MYPWGIEPCYDKIILIISLYLFFSILNCQSFEFRGLSRGKIESVFGHFTKFNIRKTDSSQNSIWEKRTLHKIQYEENGFFTKFNSIHAYVFRRVPHLPPHPPIFLEVKNVPCPFLEVRNKPFSFLEVKSKPCSFSSISKVRKLHFCRKLRNVIWKYAFGKFLH